MSRVPSDRKQEVWDRDGWRCTYCGCELTDPRFTHLPNAATVDHVVPRSRGGPNAKINLVAACAACNLSKADLMPSGRSAGDKRARALNRLIRGNPIYQLRNGQWTFGGNKFVPNSIASKLPIEKSHAGNDGRITYRIRPELRMTAEPSS